MFYRHQQQESRPPNPDRPAAETGLQEAPDRQADNQGRPDLRLAMAGPEGRKRATRMRRLGTTR